MSSNFGYIPAPIAPNLTDPTAESGNTARALNYHLAGFTYPRSHASYSAEITQRTMAELLGKGYDSAGMAVDVSGDVLDGLLRELRVLGVTRTNWIKSPTMDKDSNSDGVVDDFTSYSSGAHTVAFALDAGYQKMTVSASTGAGQSHVRQIVVPVYPGEIVSFSVEGFLASVVGGFKGRLIGEWLNSADASLGNTSGVDITATSPTTVAVENQTAPANVAKLKLYLQAVTQAGDDTGIVRFRNCLIEKATMVRPFITGTKSTPAQRVKVVGKNVIDGMALARAIVAAVNNPTYAYITGVDGRRVLALQGHATPGIYGGVSAFVPCSPGLRYTLSFMQRNMTAGSIGGKLRFLHTDGSLSDHWTSTDAWAAASITSDSGKSVQSIYTATHGTGTSYIDIDSLQLNVGTTVEPYEPYVESTAHTLPTLRRVGAVADEVDLLRGEHVRRIVDGWASIADSVYDSLDNTTYANVDVVKTTAFSAAVAGTTAADGKTYLLDKNGVPLTEIAAANIDEVASIGKYYYHTDKTVWFITAADAYADIAAARVGLGTSTLLYQLATPVVTRLPEQLVCAYQGGSLIVEGILQGSQKPNAATNKIDITGSSTSPASSIESVYRHDVQTNGQVYLTDVTSAATLTDSGTTITVTDVDATKVYSYACLIRPEYNPGCEVVTQVPLSCARHDYGAAATAWTLTTDEANAEVLVVTNAGGAADIVAPAVVRRYVVVNGSGQAITIKKSGGTGVEITDGTTVHVAYNGTDYAFVVST